MGHVDGAHEAGIEGNDFQRRIFAIAVEHGGERRVHLGKGQRVVAVVFVKGRAGYGAARETINPLLGQSPDPELVRQIRDRVLSAPNVLGIHDLIVHDYGPGRRMISLHAEVPADGDILALHDGIDRLEHELQEELACQTVIHMDPIISDDHFVTPLREKVLCLIREQIDETLQLHDFRVVTGPTHTNVIFDVVIPFNFRLTDEQLRAEIARVVREMDGEFYALVDIDHQYTE